MQAHNVCNINSQGLDDKWVTTESVHKCTLLQPLQVNTHTNASGPRPPHHASTISWHDLFTMLNTPLLSCYTTMAMAMGVVMHLVTYHKHYIFFPSSINCKGSATWGSVPQGACKWIQKIKSTITNPHAALFFYTVACSVTNSFHFLLYDTI